MCIMCRKNDQNKDFGKEINDNKGRTKRIKGGCVMCNVFLCRKGDCVKRFHERQSAMDSTG